MKLPNKINGPPGGWSYIVPETAVAFSGKASLTQLLDAVRQHYTASGYEVPKDLEAKIEAFLCERLDSYCIDDFGRQPLSIGEQLSHSFHAVLQGTATLVSWVAGGSQRVAQELADSRALVCSTCPHNQPPQGCTGCNIGALTNLVAKVAGGRKTTSDAVLHSCNVCSCGLKAKVWLPLATMWPHMPERQRARLPAFCWLVKENAARAELEKSSAQLPQSTAPAMSIS